MTAHFVNLLDDLRRQSMRMAGTVEDMVQEACEALFQSNATLARRVIERDREVDDEEVDVETETIRLMALYQPVGVDLRTLCTVLKVNNDLERIADCAVNVAERAMHSDLPAHLADNEALRQMCPLVRQILRKAIHAYGTDSAETARGVLADDAAIDAVYSHVAQQVMAAVRGQTDNTAGHLHMLLVAKNLERIADHATNIAEDVIFLSTGEIVRHEGHRRG
jgi:phosphate transport system protein